MMLTRQQHRLSNIARVANRSSARRKLQPSQYKHNISSAPRNVSFRAISHAATFIPHGPWYYSNSSSTGFITQTDAETGVRTLACSVQVQQHKESLVRRLIRKLLEWAALLKDSILITARSSVIVIRLSPLLILTPAAILSSRKWDDESKMNASIISDTSWWYCRYTIQQLGPAFVKMAQWASTRRDLFPANVCNRLSELHDSNIVHSWSYTRKVLRQMFGEDLNGLEIINKNDDVVGSGSVAQVYRGIIHDPTTKTQKCVAVKILHPNIKQKMERDIMLMKRIANIIDSLPFEITKMLSLPIATENFATILREQTDLTQEGRNLGDFRSNFLGKSSTTSGIPKISFPEPIIVERHCLVEDYIENAIPIVDYIKDNTTEGKKARRELAGPLLRSFLKMVFMDNFVHGDLHPGNVLVQKQEGKYTIVFLDAGIATKLGKGDLNNLKDLFKAVILNDGAKAGRLMVERARYERCTQTEGGLEKFSEGIEKIVSVFHNRRKQGLTLGVVRIGSLLSEVLELCRVHGVEIDPAMSNVVMSTLVLEGLGRSLDPDLNLIDCALPFVLGRGKV